MGAAANIGRAIPMRLLYSEKPSLPGSRRGGGEFPRPVSNFGQEPYSVTSAGAVTLAVLVSSLAELQCNFGQEPYSVTSAGAVTLAVLVSFLAELQCNSGQEPYGVTSAGTVTLAVLVSSLAELQCNSGRNPMALHLPEL